MAVSVDDRLGRSSLKSLAVDDDVPYAGADGHRTVDGLRHRASVDYRLHGTSVVAVAADRFYVTEEYHSRLYVNRLNVFIL